jgi:hypothetical protein
LAKLFLELVKKILEAIEILFHFSFELIMVFFECPQRTCQLFDTAHSLRLIAFRIVFERFDRFDSAIAKILFAGSMPHFSKHILLFSITFEVFF